MHRKSHTNGQVMGLINEDFDLTKGNNRKSNSKYATKHDKQKAFETYGPMDRLILTKK